MMILPQHLRMLQTFLTSSLKLGKQRMSLLETHQLMGSQQRCKQLPQSLEQSSSKSRPW